MSGGSTSSVLTWLWVSALWRAALHSLLFYLSNNLSLLCSLFPGLYFPSSLTVFHFSLLVLLRSDSSFFSLSIFNKLTKKKKTVTETTGAALRYREKNAKE